MSKATKPQETIVSSFKDAAYQSARSSETMATIARFVYTQCPTFCESQSDEIKTQLRLGWGLRWQELNPATTFDAEWKPNPKGSFNNSLDYCLSYSQQAFGQLKEADPIKHGVIKAVRDNFNKYCSNRLADLKVAVRRVENEGKPKVKAPTKQYSDFIKELFDSAKARAKTAIARGDATAPSEVKLRQAIEAFNNALK
jgi:hypothetical protein